MTKQCTRALACVATLFATAPFVAHAQDVSRIVAATLYIDSAVVERQLKTPGGTRHIQVECMPPGFRSATLQIDGDPSVHLGDVRTEPVTGVDAAACARGPLDARIRALEDQKAALQAQSRADDLTVDYLKRWNGGAGAAPPVAHAPATDRTMPAADSLRKSALELLNDQLRLAHQLADLDHQLAALQKSAHAVKAGGTWTTLRFDLSTATAGTLRLSYQMPDASWRVGYRAALDTATSTLHLDRQAEISQGSGEDWTDVSLTLAMSRVNRRSSPMEPDSWTLQVRKPASSSSLDQSRADMQRVEVTGGRTSRFANLPEAAPAVAPALDRTPVVSMGAEERDWGTLFHASQPVSLPSDGQTHTLALDSRTLSVQVRLQAVPLHELAAYLLAEAPTPAGIWPYGKLQKWRDGTLLDTEDDWSPTDSDHLALYFGRDDRVRITVRRPASMTSSTGLFGSQTQRSWGSIFVVSNGHATPQALELVDMAPVSQDESVKVVSKYDPAPTTTDWQHKPGVNAWLLKLAPNQTQQVSVSQQVTFPKDVTIGNLPGTP